MDDPRASTYLWNVVCDHEPEIPRYSGRKDMLNAVKVLEQAVASARALLTDLLVGAFTESLPRTQQEIIDRFIWAAQRMSREQIDAALLAITPEEK